MSIEIVRLVIGVVGLATALVATCSAFENIRTPESKEWQRIGRLSVAAYSYALFIGMISALHKPFSQGTAAFSVAVLVAVWYDVLWLRHMWRTHRRARHVIPRG